MEETVDALIEELYKKYQLHGSISDNEIIDAVIEHEIPLFYVTVINNKIKQKKDTNNSSVNEKLSAKDRKQKYDSTYEELSTKEPIIVKESFFSDYRRASIQSTYIPVFVLAFFAVSDSFGIAHSKDVIEFYRNFYYIRKGKGLIVERPDSIFIQSSVDDKDIRRLILYNPMGRSFLRKYFRFSKLDDNFIINPKLKIALDENDLKEINIISNRLLDYYYNKINDNLI